MHSPYDFFHGAIGHGEALPHLQEIGQSLQGATLLVVSAHGLGQRGRDADNCSQFVQ
jgi:hypothetical protein